MMCRVLCKSTAQMLDGTYFLKDFDGLTLLLKEVCVLNGKSLSP